MSLQTIFGSVAADASCCRKMIQVLACEMLCRTVAEPDDRAPAADVDPIPHKRPLGAPHVVQDGREDLARGVGPTLCVWHCPLDSARAHGLRSPASLRSGRWLSLQKSCGRSDAACIWAHASSLPIGKVACA